jgi:iron complex transport system ATP-binding protein
VAIKVENLRLGYGSTVIVDDISMEVPQGSFCSVIGPNGCGKSTLLRALSRNLHPFAGTIEILGKAVHSYDSKELSRKMAFLAQSPHIPDQFTVEELVSYGRYPHSHWPGFLSPADRDIIHTAMKLTETDGFADRELTSLSGGERQRVWIAMALAQEAELLLLDEPTTYLDIAHQFQTLELIHRLQKNMGRTILMVLHDLNQAARYSDWIFVMKDGKLFDQGPPEDIISEELLAEVFSIRAKVIRDDDHGCPFFIPLGEVAL